MKMKARVYVVLSVQLLCFLLGYGFPGPSSAETVRADSAYTEIESRHVDLWSNGTRVSGDLWRPKGLKAGDKHPAIILCHGWGGVRSHLNSSYAPAFAKAGYVVLTFDYRGWGDSDSRLVIKGKMPAPDANGEIMVRGRAIRELVGPFAQTEDIIHCIDFLSGEPGVDPRRIGLWGTSFGGGHVLYLAAHDDRVKCIVSQVPAMDHHWVYFMFNPREMATREARGEMDPIPQGTNTGLTGTPGTPYLSRIARYHPVLFAGQLKVPILIIVADQDKLINNRENGKKVYDLVKDRVPSKYEVLPGGHFDIYDQGRSESIAMALAWFNKYLKPASRAEKK